MRTENFTVKKFIDSLYSNEIQKADDEVIYCEIQYQRDRSSFAGVALKITNDKNAIRVRQCEEKIIQDVSKYEKLLSDINPEFAEKQEQKAEIDTLKLQMAEMSKSITSLMESNKSLIEKLTTKTNRNENVGN